MKKLTIFFISILIVSASGCQKIHLPWGKKSIEQTNDIFSENIREEFVSTNTNSENVNTNENMTEPVKPGSMTNELPGIHEKTPLAVEPEVGENAGSLTNKSNTVSMNTEIKKQSPVKENTNVEKPSIVKKIQKKNKVKKEKNINIKEQPAENEKARNGLIVMIGSGTANQNAAPRKLVKMTFVAVSKSRDYKYCDFIIYAMPVGKGKILDSDYIIGEAKNIDIVNGQAQYTKYWNGMNVDDDFLPQDNYNIYIYYKLKNAKYEVLKKEGRYWGVADKNYISLK